jgi:hypothetical protein
LKRADAAAKAAGLGKGKDNPIAWTIQP